VEETATMVAVKKQEEVLEREEVVVLQVLTSTEL
jgi:hypothetical protein